MSRFSYRGNALDQSAIQEILLGKRQYLSWEQRLYERGNDLSGKFYYKYPLELMAEEESRGNMNAMVIEIYDTDPQKLDSKRNFLKLIGKDSGETIGKIKQLGEKVWDAFAGGEGQEGVTGQEPPPSIPQSVLDAFVQVNEGSPDPKDTVGRGEPGSEPGGFAAKILNALNAAAYGGQAAINLLGLAYLATTSGATDPTKNFDRLQMDSMIEETTAVKGGTSKVLHRIYLYIPNNIQADYGVEYETTNMSGMDVLKLVGAIIRDGDAESTGAIAKKIALGNLKIFESGLQILGVGGDLDSLQKKVSAVNRQVTNPMSLHLFKDVKRRSFSFAYTFMPKNQAEMSNCYAIINTLKYYAHPATSDKARFLDYPAEFMIKFTDPQATSGLNAYLPVILKCALTGIKVTYGEDSVMSMFERDKNGAPPTKIKLELTFDELEILTRDRFSLDPGAPNP